MHTAVLSPIEANVKMAPQFGPTTVTKTNRAQIAFNLPFLCLYRCGERESPGQLGEGLQLFYTSSTGAAVILIGTLNTFILV